MATKEETLKSVLATACGVNVYPLEKPKDNNHCITYREISSKKFRSLTAKVDLSRERYLITCYGTSYSQVRSLSDLVYGALECNNTNFNWASCENEADQPKMIDANVYSKQLEFFVW